MERKERHDHKWQSIIWCICALAMLYAVGSPLVRGLLQQGEVKPMHLIDEQKEVVAFLPTDIHASNDANQTLNDLYVYFNGDTLKSQASTLGKEDILLSQDMVKLQTKNTLLTPLSMNTSAKIKLLLIFLPTVLHSTTSRDDLIEQMNALTVQYKKSAHTETTELLHLLNQVGIAYRVLPNGQLQYFYFDMKSS